MASLYLGVLCPELLQQFWNQTATAPAAPVGGASYVLYTYLAGTTTPTPTYTDASLGLIGGANTNPVVLNAAGQANVFLNPTITYKFVYTTSNDTNPPTSPIYTVDNVSPPLQVGSLTQALLAGILYPQSTAEAALSATVVQAWYPYGYVDRYGINASPGVTDMSSAVQAAINVALAVGCPVVFQGGAYLINTAPTIPGVAPDVMITLQIEGDGLGTVLYNGSSGYLFAITSGCYVHDFQIATVAGLANGGLSVSTAGGIQPIGWRIERVYTRVQGVGILLSSTNTGVIRDCWHWADNAPALPIAISPAGGSVSHGIYATGSFVNDVSIYDFRSAVSTNYVSGQRWIKNDCTDSFNFRIRGGLPVNESPSTSQQVLELGANAGTSIIVGAEVTGVYHESGWLGFAGVSFSNIYSCTDGGVADTGGVGLKFTFNSQANVIGANSEAGSMSFDSGSGGNAIMGGLYASFSDSAVTIPNAYQNANRSAAYGGIIDNTLVYSASMTPNMLAGNYIRIVATNGTAFTINAPTNPALGMRATILIYNGSGGALGTITWNAIFKMSTWTSPASGYNRSIDFFYDGVHWVQASQTGVDIPN